MSILKSGQLLKQELRNEITAKIRNYNSISSEEEKQIITSIKQKGYYVVPNFYSEAQCEKITKEIDRLILEYKDQIRVDEQKSDHRIFGANKASSLIQAFYADELITRIIQSYEGSNKMLGFTLAGKLKAKEKNLGSGGGWHRDSASAKQTKAILYLTDVNENSGPFQYIQGSHTSKSFIKTTLKYNFEFNQNRFSDKEIDKIIQQYPEKLFTLLGKAGSLIFVDTRGIHRGKPIEKGIRYALTNYTWFNMEIPSHIKSSIINEKD